MDDRFTDLLSQIKISFKDSNLLERAFTHRSFLNEGGKDLESNERLEFFGDAILSFLVSQHLYQTYPDYPEGMLTNVRSKIVKTETLASVAESLQFGTYLHLSHGEDKSGGRTNKSLLADTFEAFLGALYLDQGLTAAKSYLKSVLFPLIPAIIKTQLYSDYKSRLQEIVQVYSKVSPTYKVVKSEGPDHDKRFWVTVVIDDVEHEIGTGKSKQDAEQAAARLTLEKMGKI